MKKQTELTKELLVTQVFSICIKSPRTIEEITQKIYRRLQAKNIVKVYQCCEILMSRGVLVPKFQNRELRFQVSEELLKD